jgi:hypothetical protein
VWLPADAEWLEEWKKEHAGMVGNGVRPRHDDQIDTAAYCVLELLGVGGVEESPDLGGELVGSQGAPLSKQR